MEKEAVVRNCEIRKMTSGLSSPKSGADCKPPKRQLMFLDGSDKCSDNAKKDEFSASEDEADEKDAIVLKHWLLDQAEKSHGEQVTEDRKDGRIVRGKRKRIYTSFFYDNVDSDDSVMLASRGFGKLRRIMDEDESSEEGRSSWGSSSSENVEDADSEPEVEEEPLCRLSLSPIESSETDSMDDFIGEEDDGDNIEHGKSEKQPQQKELLNTSSSDLLAHYVPCSSYCDHYGHFKRVVKAFFINANDDTFLRSLYDGTTQEKSALELLFSLQYLDDCFIQPRLMNLVSRSCWKHQYKELVDCYPDVHFTPVNQACEACELNHSCEFYVLLSGKPYNSRTFQVEDFMSDDKQVLKVGMKCADHTRVYHHLKHFRYKLYVDCSSVAKLDGVEDESVADKVERLLSRLEDCGWILTRYDDLRESLNEADKFLD